MGDIAKYNETIKRSIKKSVSRNKNVMKRLKRDLSRIGHVNCCMNKV